MAKILLMPILLIFACLFAGGYGAAHNQISYTVAPEYFTEFKFHQFRIPDSFSDRAGAAIVGWLASWWMGVFIGVILIPLGLLIPGTPRHYFWSMIRVFWIVAATTFVVGLVALGVSFLVVNSETVGEFTRYNNEIVDDAAFARAGTMHNFGYAGGVLGIVTGAIAIFRLRRIPITVPPQPEHPAHQRSD